jgi:hypothetical protein
MSRIPCPIAYVPLPMSRVYARDSQRNSCTNSFDEPKSLKALLSFLVIVLHNNINIYRVYTSSLILISRRSQQNQVMQSNPILSQTPTSNAVHHAYPPSHSMPFPPSPQKQQQYPTPSHQTHCPPKT